MPPLPPINLGIGAEIIYSFVVIVCSLMIYFGTKELYELSSYKGIKYFRQAFLFFAIAYLFRFIIEFITISFNSQVLGIYPMIFDYFALFVFMYLSSLSIFYLVYSMSWKKFKDRSKMPYICHAIAIIIAFASIFFRNEIFYIGINILLLVSAIIMVGIASYNQKHKLKKKNNLLMTYLLLFIFFILNVFNILVPIFLESLSSLFILCLWEYFW